MRTRALVAPMLLAALIGAGCDRGAERGSSSPSATTPATADAGVDADLARDATLRQDDVPQGWQVVEPNEDPATIRVGGKVGTDNAPGRVTGRHQVAYEEGSDPAAGYVGDTVLVMGGDDDAKKFLADYRAAAATTSWTQDFESTQDSFTLQPLGIDRIGDESFAVTITDRATHGESKEVQEATFEYIVVRVGRVVSVVLASNTPNAADLARAAEKRVREALGT